MSINIRPVSESDFPRLVELFHEFSVFEKTPAKMNNSVDRMLAEKNFFNAFVAETEDHLIVGYVAYFYCYFTWSGKSIFMDDLYVQPDFRGHGLGSRFIQEVADIGKAYGCHSMRWQVSKWNQPAIDFYKKLGAEIDGTEENCVWALT